MPILTSERAFSAARFVLPRDITPTVNTTGISAPTALAKP